jgi:protein phosphatase 2C family protein 2/3
MEDAVDVHADLGGAEPTAYYAVHDGHNGVQAVNFVRARLPKAISEMLRETQNVEAAVHEAFVQIDAQLLVHQQRHPHRRATDHAPGCVSCVTIIRGAAITIANLGDCRAIVCVDGKMTQLTRDHNPSTNKEERRRLEEQGVELSCKGYLQGHLAVSRAFGEWAYNQNQKCQGVLSTPEFAWAPVTPLTEFLLLGCDGIFEKMDAENAGKIVRHQLRRTGSAEAAAQGLVRHALKGGSSDNLSAVVILFKRPPSIGDVARSAPPLFG